MGPPSFHVNSWQAAEENAARWMRSWGFYDAHVTTTGADGGIDVTSYGAEAQVKFQAAAVGRPAIQNLAGAAKSNCQLMFFSGSLYSAQAIAFADTRRVALFTYDLTGAVAAVNAAAYRVIRESSERTAASTVQVTPSAHVAPTPPSALIPPITPSAHVAPKTEAEYSIGTILLGSCLFGLWVLGITNVDENPVLGWILMTPAAIMGAVMLWIEKHN